MKNYAKEVERVGIGRTPQLCQDALKEMLEELFEGKTYSGQEGRKPLKIIRRTTTRTWTRTSRRRPTSRLP